jgi:uncharacterized membrane protein YjdF
MKKINTCLIIIILICGFFTIIFNDQKNVVVFLKDASIVFTILLPYIFEKVTKRSLNDVFKTIWIIFIIMAHYLGVILEFYNIYPGYDKVTHCMSGFLTAYVGYMMVDKIKSKNNFINAIIIVSFSALCAVSWEIFEFTCNIFFGGDAQRVAETGVDDTMWDMIVALIGATIFSMCSVMCKKSDQN